MKQTKIDLLEPFEKVLGAVLSAPENHKVIGGCAAQTGAMFAKRGNQGPAGSAEIRGLLRCIYEAAHGRQVETEIGHVAIAPPVAASLKETPFYIKTQVDFLLEALTRIIRGASRFDSGVPPPQPRRKGSVESHARNNASNIESKNHNAKIDIQPNRFPRPKRPAFLE
jgi:hypothetical protein